MMAEAVRGVQALNRSLYAAANNVVAAWEDKQSFRRKRKFEGSSSYSKHYFPYRNSRGRGSKGRGRGGGRGGYSAPGSYSSGHYETGPANKREHK